MIDAPLALAFTAGMVARINPCSFALLPRASAHSSPAMTSGSAQTVGTTRFALAIVAIAFVAFRLRNRNVATLEPTTMTQIAPTPTSNPADRATSRETTAAP